MRTAILAAPLMALALAACGGSEPEATPAQNAAADQALEGVEQRVAALSAGQRHGVFIRAIRDAGVGCQGVTGSEKSPPPAKATWVANCGDGSRHIIAFTADGMARVTSMTRQGQ